MPISRDLLQLIQHAIESIRPARLIETALRLEGAELVVPARLLFPGQAQTSRRPTEARFALRENVYLVAFGKAALGMTLAVEKLVGERHLVRGIGIVPFNDAVKLGSAVSLVSAPDDALQEMRLPGQSDRLRFYFGARNNLPDRHSCAATRQVVEMCAGLRETDLLIALVSGGGSALLCAPVGPAASVSNDERLLRLKLETTRRLVSAGATINELNAVRSCLSGVKAGKLAGLARASAAIVALVVSDVIDDPLDVIASGPTCTHLMRSKRDQAQRALEVIESRGVAAQLPAEVLAFLKATARGDVEVKDDQGLSHGDLEAKVYNYLIGNNRLATAAIVDESKSAGLDYELSVSLGNGLCGEAKVVGAAFACLAYALVAARRGPISGRDELIAAVRERVQAADRFREEMLAGLESLVVGWLAGAEWADGLGRTRKICLTSGGETTVNLASAGPNAVGGRNQEMTLAFELAVNVLLRNDTANPRGQLVFASFGSDGIDGPTDAAGAFYACEAGGHVSASSSAASLEPLEAHLAEHNSYAYFAETGRLLQTGATGTNVSDLQILLADFDPA